MMGSFGDWKYQERLKSPDLECSVRRMAVRVAPSCELIAVHHALVMKRFLTIGYQVEESRKISICTVDKNGSLLGSCDNYCTLNAEDMLTNLLQWAKFIVWSRARYFIFLKNFRPNKPESLSLSIFKKRLFILATVWLLAFSPGLVLGQAKVQPANTTPEIQDVSYGKHPRNVLDFFPAESESPTPALIYFHGGGFVAGDKGFVRRQPLVRDCLTNGISVVSANYRFVAGPDSEPFPGSLLDGVRVVQFVRSMAKEWNLDSERIVLSGGSAGALMSLWIALHDEFADTKSDDPLVQQSSRVLGVVAYAGPTTIDPRVIVEHVGGNPKIHPSIFPIFNIKKIEELEQPSMREKVEEFSPLSHVSPDDPPLQLRYGGTLAGTPLPENTNVGISIHHARFGDLLRGKYKVVGSKQLVELVCSDCPHADATEIDFLRRVFGLRVQ